MTTSPWAMTIGILAELIRDSARHRFRRPRGRPIRNPREPSGGIPSGKTQEGAPAKLEADLEFERLLTAFPQSRHCGSREMGPLAQPFNLSEPSSGRLLGSDGLSAAAGRKERSRSRAAVQGLDSRVQAEVTERPKAEIPPHI